MVTTKDFDNLKENHIYEFASSLQNDDKKLILYYYFKKLDEIVGMIKEYITWLHFVRRNDTYYQPRVYRLLR